MSVRSVVMLVGVFTLCLSGANSSTRLSAAVNSGVGPTLESTGPIAFGPDGVLFVADNQAATIYALELGSHESGPTAGTTDVAAVDRKIAALLGTEAAQIHIADLAA